MTSNRLVVAIAAGALALYGGAVLAEQVSVDRSLPSYKPVGGCRAASRASARTR